ncbi:MAG: hypothetical protein ACH346_08135, partial [Chthoniobacterales bacterium]
YRLQEEASYADRLQVFSSTTSTSTSNFNSHIEDVSRHQVTQATGYRKRPATLIDCKFFLLPLQLQLLTSTLTSKM